MANINKLRNNYQTIASLIPLKSSYYDQDAKISSSQFWMYVTLFTLFVIILAGILTGFGAAAPVISAIVSLFSVVNAQIGILALGVFLIYAIPWALVYIPEVGRLFRSFWENYSDKSQRVSKSSLALSKAHDVLQMIYRKEIKLMKQPTQPSDLDMKNALDITANVLIESYLMNGDNEYEAILGFQLKQACDAKDVNAFKEIINQLPFIKNLTLTKDIDDFVVDGLKGVMKSDLKDKNYTKNLHEKYKTWLKAHDESTDVKERVIFKYRAKNAWAKIRVTDPKKSFYTRVFSFLGSLLGILNASLANTTGTALAPLFIIATLFMMFALPGATFPFYASIALLSLFALAGFVAAYGLTKKSIENAFNKISDFFNDNIKTDQKREKNSKLRFIDKPYTYLKHINNKYAILPILMSLFLAVAIASFNFLAGVIFGHILLYPAILTSPIAIASFSISSLAGLHAVELIFGIIGFSFTVIAVTPLMVGAWQAFTKSLTLEPLSNNKLITLTAFLSSFLNTMLLARMMLRPGSPLNLFFGAFPVLVKIIAIIAPICIFLLGFALFYMGIKQMFSDRGHDHERIMSENFDLKYTPRQASLSDELKSIIEQQSVWEDSPHKDKSKDLGKPNEDKDPGSADRLADSDDEYEALDDYPNDDPLERSIEGSPELLPGHENNQNN